MQITTKYPGRRFSFIIVIIAVLVGGMTEWKKEKEFAATCYTGRALNIAVVGSFPDIREENIRFETITLPELISMEYTKEYDALFIRKEYLEEASQYQYAEVYQNSSIPTFFFETKKLDIPFMIADQQYEDVDINIDYNYIVGTLDMEDGKWMRWEYDIYEKKDERRNRQKLLSEVFRTIESLQ